MRSSLFPADAIQPAGGDVSVADDEEDVPEGHRRRAALVHQGIDQRQGAPGIHVLKWCLQKSVVLGRTIAKNCISGFKLLTSHIEKY